MKKTKFYIMFIVAASLLPSCRVTESTYDYSYNRPYWQHNYNPYWGSYYRPRWNNHYWQNHPGYYHNRNYGRNLQWNRH